MVTVILTEPLDSIGENFELVMEIFYGGGLFEFGEGSYGVIKD